MPARWSGRRRSDEQRADILGQAARTVEQEGDAGRAEAMRHTCRKIRIQALLDRCRAAAATRRAEGEA